MVKRSSRMRRRRSQSVKNELRENIAAHLHDPSNGLAVDISPSFGQIQGIARRLKNDPEFSIGVNDNLQELVQGLKRDYPDTAETALLDGHMAKLSRGNSYADNVKNYLIEKELVPKGVEVVPVVLKGNTSVFKVSLAGEQLALRVTKDASQNEVNRINKVNNEKSLAGVLTSADSHGIIEDAMMGTNTVSELTEFCSNGSLAKPRAAAQNNLKQLGTQLIDMIEQCREAGFAHSDIKAGNFLISESGNLVMSDKKGLCSFEEFASNDRTITRTPASYPPEVHLAIKADPKTAIDYDQLSRYQVGLCLYHYVTGEDPMKHERDKHGHHKGLNLEHRALEQNPEYAAVIRGLLATAPEERMSLAAAKTSLMGIQEPKLSAAKEIDKSATLSEIVEEKLSGLTVKTSMNDLKQDRIGLAKNYIEKGMPELAITNLRLAATHAENSDDKIILASCVELVESKKAEKNVSAAPPERRKRRPSLSKRRREKPASATENKSRRFSQLFRQSRQQHANANNTTINQQEVQNTQTPKTFSEYTSEGPGKDMLGEINTLLVGINQSEVPVSAVRRNDAALENFKKTGDMFQFREEIVKSYYETKDSQSENLNQIGRAYVNLLDKAVDLKQSFDNAQPQQHKLEANLGKPR